MISKDDLFTSASAALVCPRKNQNDERTVTITKASKPPLYQGMVAKINKILLTYFILKNSYYCRHPLKIYTYVRYLLEKKYKRGSYSPVICVPTFVGEFYFVTDCDIIKAILKYPRLDQGELLSEGRQLRIIAEALGRFRLNTERSDMKAKRSVLAHLVSKPERYLPKMLEIADRLVEKWRSNVNKPIIITKDISEFTVEIFLDSIMNYKGPFEPIVSILEKQIDLLGRRLAYQKIPGFQEKFCDLRNKLMHYLDTQHKGAGSPTEYENRLTGYVDQHCKDQEREAFATGLNGGVLAGYLAPNPSFCAAVYELAKHPEWQGKLVSEWRTASRLGSSQEQYINAENTLLNAVIHEILRLNPAQPFLFRNVEQSFTIDGTYNISQGSQIIVDLYHSLRDHSQWGPDAEQFNPLRFMDKPELYRQPFLVYSSGPNNCTGQYFSRQSLKVFVHSLCKNFTWETLSKNVTHKFHFALTLSQDIVIKLTSLQ